MSLKPRSVNQYHVFLASPGDVAAERQCVRKFFDEYNRHTAHIWNVEFKVVDWENYATIGVGRPQELITAQTLEKYRQSLALVVGIMGQRFGSPTGKAESGTEEEFNWAMKSHQATGFPEIKWFFRKVDQLDVPADPAEAIKALEQWQKVLAFRQRMQDLKNPIFYTEYPGAAGFGEVFERDLNLWLADAARPWAAERAAQLAAGGAAMPARLPAEFDAERYRADLYAQASRVLLHQWDTERALVDYPGMSTEILDYVKALVTPLAADDRILAWDLCNEPQAADLNSEPNKREFQWLSEVAATVRGCGARQPVLIGTMQGTEHVRTYAPLVDVLCTHPYAHDRKGLADRIEAYRKLCQETAKPLLVNEAIPGCLDDTKRAEVVKFYHEQLSEAGFGWMGWVVREGLAISTRRDRYDGNGIGGQGFHPFFTKEGKLRGGLEFLTEKPKLRAPWEKA